MARTNLTHLAGSNAPLADNRAEAERQRLEALIAEDADDRERYMTSGLAPDWLGTAAAGASAGWIFGPVGGLVGMAVTHVLQKQRRQGIAVQAAANAETGASLIEGGERSLARLEAAAETDQDRLEVELLREQFEQAATLARNPDPRASMAGFQALLGIPGLAQDEADEIEAAALAREQREREQAKRWQDQAINLRNRNEQESRPYLEQARAFKQLDGLFEDGLQDADRTLVANLVARIVNPGEIITEGDVAVIAGAGSLDQAAANRINAWIRGAADLDVNTAIQLRESMKDIVRVAYEDQIDRNKMAIDFAKDLELPQRFLDNIAINSRDLAPADFEKRSLQSVLDDMGIAPEPAEPELIDNGSPARRFIRDNLSEPAFEFLGIEPGQDVVEYNGRQYTLEDHGEGRRSWVPVEGFLKRKIREAGEGNAERMLTDPGLFQPGGAFGRPFNQDEQRRRRELLDRRRPTSD